MTSRWLAVLGVLLPALVGLPSAAATAACDPGRPANLGETELDALFAGPGLGATAGLEGYGGGDYPHAYPLGGNRVLWLFQDLHYSNDDNLASPPNYAAHNAGLLQEGDCFTILGGRGRDLIGDAQTADSRRWFWPLDGELDADGQLTIFMAEMANPQGTGAGPGTLPVRTWMAILDPVTLTQRYFAPVEPHDARLFGWSVVTAGEWSYLYAHCNRQWLNGSVGVDGFDPSCSPHWYLARVPAGRFDAPYQYWDGGGWSGDAAAAAPVYSRGYSDPMSVQFFGDVFVSVTKHDDWQGTTMSLDVAPAPQGPWRQATVEVTHDDRRCDDECGNYGASLLPWTDAAGNLVVALSNGGRFDLWRANGALYRPEFFTFPVPPREGPPPAPLGAPAGDAGFLPVDPQRLVDTRQPGGPFGRLDAGALARLPLGAMPPGAAAVALNLTSDLAAADGWLRVWPCSEPEPATSNLNPTPWQVRTNAAVVPVGSGELCLRSKEPVDVIVDLNGWLTTDSMLGVDVLTGQRLLDTRTGHGGFTRLAADQEFTVPIPGAPAGAVLSVTSVEAGAAGFVTLWPCGTPRPTVSNLNQLPGVTVPNLVNVRVGAGGAVCGYTKSATDLLVDLVGVYRTGAAARYAGVAPVRLVDTRGSEIGRHGVDVARVIALGDVVAAQANVTVTAPEGPGYATAYRCLSEPRPVASNLNYGYGETRAGATLLPVSRGHTCVFLKAPGGLVVDISGAWVVP